MGAHELNRADVELLRDGLRALMREESGKARALEAGGFDATPADERYGAAAVLASLVEDALAIGAPLVALTLPAAAPRRKAA